MKNLKTFYTYLNLSFVFLQLAKHARKIVSEISPKQWKLLYIEYTYLTCGCSHKISIYRLFRVAYFSS